MSSKLLASLYEFKPDLILISAGASRHKKTPGLYRKRALQSDVNKRVHG